MTRGSETGEPERAAVEALYDAFAPPLYRYAWALLGDDPEQVAEAVHDGLVAGVALDARRSDPDDRGPWLYALVRSACQRRGLAHVSPYTRLATVPAEAPVARMFSRLPASHRELVELHLRHALSTSAGARVLGLDPVICGELTRSAVRRAAESLAEAEGAGEASGPRAGARREGRHAAGADPRDGGEGDRDTAGSAAWRAQVHRVSCALALLRPPGPPPGLRDRVLDTCLDPALAAVRDRVAASMRPLTGEGYPLHRSRVPGEPEQTLVESGAGPEALPRALGGDRLTTADHPAHEESATPLPGPHAATGDDEPRHGRSALRRWPLPAVSGLATAAVAVALWSWAGAVSGPSTVIGAAPAESGHGPQVSDVETASTASDSKPEAEPTGPPPPVSPAPSAPGSAEQPADAVPGEEPTGDGAPDDGRQELAPPRGEHGPPAEGAPDDGSDEDGSEDDDAPGDPPEEDGSDDGGGGGGGGLFSGLLGLLFGGG